MQNALNGALEVLHRAGTILSAPADLHADLASIAALCAKSFCAYCAIEVVALRPDAGPFGVESGSREHSCSGAVASEPLRAGRETFGKITCAGLAPDAAPQLASVVSILATQIAAAIAVWGVATRERRVADRLQRALLPRQLPNVPGVTLTVSYVPASDEADVGGDWYDAFALPDGRLAITVGDVAGHGLDAAVVMGELRQIARAAAVAATRPTEVLGQVNDAFNLLSSSAGMVTSIFAVYDPATGIVSYAVAGHPPPILALEDGSAWVLPAGGLPIGASTDLQSRDWTFTVPAGGTLLFYTDGLIENDRDVVRGEADLLRAAANLALRGEFTAEHINQAVLAGAPNRDDAAALTLTSNVEVSEFVFSSIPIVAPLVRAIFKPVFQSMLSNEEKRFGALVALTEACANAIEHGYGGEPRGVIRVKLDRREKDVEITVSDEGGWRPFVRNHERGRGFAMMQAFTDGVQIRSRQNQTEVALRLDVPG